MERRKHRRIVVSDAVAVRVVTEERVVAGRVVDLNNAGAFIASDLDVEPHQRLRIEIEIETADRPRRLDAIVVRAAAAVQGDGQEIPAGFGVVFLPRDGDERDFIQTAVLEVLRGSLAEPAPGVDDPTP